MRLYELQAGSVLLMSLVILLVMTLLGVGGINLSSMQQRMAGSTQLRQDAFQAAEAALRDAEMHIALSDPLGPFSNHCANGFCEPASHTKQVWQDSSQVDWLAGTNTIRYGTHTGNPWLVNVATQPRYIIERLPVTAPMTGECYRITAVGFPGARQAAQVTLQSVYRQGAVQGLMGRQSWRQID